MKVIIIKHIDIEGPGTIGDFLDDNNTPYKIIDVFNGESLPDSLAGVSATVILGQISCSTS